MSQQPSALACVAGRPVGCHSNAVAEPHNGDGNVCDESIRPVGQLIETANSRPVPRSAETGDGRPTFTSNSFVSSGQSAFRLIPDATWRAPHSHAFRCSAARRRRPAIRSTVLGLPASRHGYRADYSRSSFDWCHLPPLLPHIVGMRVVSCIRSAFDSCSLPRISAIRPFPTMRLDI